jgi:hypothetical protein
MDITSRTYITRGMDITDTFVVPGGRGAGGSMVTTRMSGRIEVITGRLAMATGEPDFAVEPNVNVQGAAGGVLVRE